MNGNLLRGKSKFLSFAALGFLVISLFAITYTTSSGVRTFLSEAAKTNWRDIGNPKLRQAARRAAEEQAAAVTKTTQTTNLTPQELQAISDAARRAQASGVTVDYSTLVNNASTYKAAVEGDDGALATLKALPDSTTSPTSLYNRALQDRQNLVNAVLRQEQISTVVSKEAYFNEAVNGSDAALEVLKTTYPDLVDEALRQRQSKVEAALRDQINNSYTAAVQGDDNALAYLKGAAPNLYTQALQERQKLISAQQRQAQAPLQVQSVDYYYNQAIQGNESALNILKGLDSSKYNQALQERQNLVLARQREQINLAFTAAQQGNEEALAYLKEVSPELYNKALQEKQANELFIGLAMQGDPGRYLNLYENVNLNYTPEARAQYTLPNGQLDINKINPLYLKSSAVSLAIPLTVAFAPPTLYYGGALLLAPTGTAAFATAEYLYPVLTSPVAQAAGTVLSTSFVGYTAYGALSGPNSQAYQNAQQFLFVSYMADPIGTTQMVAQTTTNIVNTAKALGKYYPSLDFGTGLIYGETSGVYAQEAAAPASNVPIVNPSQLLTGEQTTGLAIPSNKGPAYGVTLDFGSMMTAYSGPGPYTPPEFNVSWEWNEAYQAFVPNWIEVSASTPVPAVTVLPRQTVAYSDPARLLISYDGTIANETVAISSPKVINGELTVLSQVPSAGITTGIPYTPIQAARTNLVSALTAGQFNSLLNGPLSNPFGNPVAAPNSNNVVTSLNRPINVGGVFSSLRNVVSNFLSTDINFIAAREIAIPLNASPTIQDIMTANDNLAREVALTKSTAPEIPPVAEAPAPQPPAAPADLTQVTTAPDGDPFVSVEAAYQAESTPALARRVTDIQNQVPNLDAQTIAQLIFEAKYTDGLTGLVNRTGFTEGLDLEIASSAEHGTDLTVVTMDLKKFKTVNDTLGHVKGDEALKAVADILKRNARSTDLVVRISGDEFALVLPQTNEAQARNLMQRILTDLETQKSQPGASDFIKLVDIDYSAKLWTKTDTVDGFLNSLDLSMYEQKRGAAVAPASIAQTAGQLARMVADRTFSAISTAFSGISSALTRPRVNAITSSYTIITILTNLFSPLPANINQEIAKALVRPPAAIVQVVPNPVQNPVIPAPKANIPLDEQIPAIQQTKFGSNIVNPHFSSPTSANPYSYIPDWFYTKVLPKLDLTCGSQAECLAKFNTLPMADGNGEFQLDLKPDFVPSGLVNMKDYGIPVATNNNQIAKDAAPMVKKLIDDLNNHGYGVIVSYGYRSYGEQAIMREQYGVRAGNAGESMHQGGQTVDLFRTRPNGTINPNKPLQTTDPIQQILHDNGFVRPFMDADPPHVVALDAVYPGLTKILLDAGLNPDDKTILKEVFLGMAQAYEFQLPPNSTIPNISAAVPGAAVKPATAVKPFADYTFYSQVDPQWQGEFPIGGVGKVSDTTCSIFSIANVTQNNPKDVWLVMKRVLKIDHMPQRGLSTDQVLKVLTEGYGYTMVPISHISDIAKYTSQGIPVYFSSRNVVIPGVGLSGHHAMAIGLDANGNIITYDSSHPSVAGNGWLSGAGLVYPLKNFKEDPRIFAAFPPGTSQSQVSPAGQGISNEKVVDVQPLNGSLQATHYNSPDTNGVDYHLVTARLVDIKFNVSAPVRMPTSRFLTQTQSDVAINADGYDYFNPYTDPATGQIVYRTEGPTIINGVTYRAMGSEQSLYFDASGNLILDGSGSTLTLPKTKPDNAVSAISFPNLLIDGGQALPITSSDTSANARTAMGITADGRVIIITFDGSQNPNGLGLTGATISDVQKILQKNGAVIGINFDGGDSPSMSGLSPDGKVIPLNTLNPDTGGEEPLVASHLGIKVISPPPSQSPSGFVPVTPGALAASPIINALGSVVAPLYTGIPGLAAQVSTWLQPGSIQYGIDAVRNSLIRLFTGQTAPALQSQAIPISPQEKTLNSVLSAFDKYGSRMQEAKTLSRQGITGNQNAFDILKSIANENGVAIKLVDQQTVPVVESGKIVYRQLTGKNAARISADGKNLYVLVNPNRPTLPASIEDVLHDVGAILMGGKFVPKGQVAAFTTEELVNLSNGKLTPQFINEKLVDAETKNIPVTGLFDQLIDGVISRDAFSGPVPQPPTAPTSQINPLANIQLFDTILPNNTQLQYADPVPLSLSITGITNPELSIVQQIPQGNDKPAVVGVLLYGTKGSEKVLLGYAVSGWQTGENEATMSINLLKQLRGQTISSQNETVKSLLDGIENTNVLYALWINPTIQSQGLGKLLTAFELSRLEALGITKASIYGDTTITIGKDGVARSYYVDNFGFTLENGKEFINTSEVVAKYQGMMENALSPSAPLPPAAPATKPNALQVGSQSNTLTKALRYVFLPIHYLGKLPIIKQYIQFVKLNTSGYTSKISPFNENIDDELVSPLLGVTPYQWSMTILSISLDTTPALGGKRLGAPYWLNDFPSNAGEPYFYFMLGKTGLVGINYLANLFGLPTVNTSVSVGNTLFAGLSYFGIWTTNELGMWTYGPTPTASPGNIPRYALGLISGFASSFEQIKYVPFGRFSFINSYLNWGIKRSFDTTKLAESVRSRLSDVRWLVQTDLDSRHTFESYGLVDPSYTEQDKQVLDLAASDALSILDEMPDKYVEAFISKDPAQIKAVEQMFADYRSRIALLSHSFPYNVQSNNDKVLYQELLRKIENAPQPPTAPAQKLNLLQRYVNWVNNKLLPPLGIVQPDMTRLINLDINWRGFIGSDGKLQWPIGPSGPSGGGGSIDPPDQFTLMVFGEKGSSQPPANTVTPRLWTAVLLLAVNSANTCTENSWWFQGGRNAAKLAVGAGLGYWGNQMTQLAVKDDNLNGPEKANKNPNYRPIEDIIDEGIKLYKASHSKVDVSWNRGPSFISQVDLARQFAKPVTKDSLEYQIINGACGANSAEKMIGKPLYYIFELKPDLLTPINKTYADKSYNCISSLGSLEYSHVYGSLQISGGTIGAEFYDSLISHENKPNINNPTTIQNLGVENSNLTSEIENKVLQSGGPISASNVISYFLDKDNGDLDLALVDTANYLKFQSRTDFMINAGTTHSPLLQSQSANWMKNNILDEFSSYMPYQQLPSYQDTPTDPLYPANGLLKNNPEYDAFGQNQYFKDFSLINRVGVPYHVFSLIALIHSNSPEILSLGVLGQGDPTQYGLLRWGDEVKFLGDLYGLEDYLNTYNPNPEDYPSCTKNEK